MVLLWFPQGFVLGSSGCAGAHRTAWEHVAEDGAVLRPSALQVMWATWGNSTGGAV